MSNRFAALDLEDDEPVVQQPKATKAKTAEVKAKPTTEKAAPAARPAPVKAVTAPGTNAIDDAEPSRARRGGKPPSGGGRKADRPKQTDRHVSGTGRGKEISKDGAGKFSWGKAGDEGKPAEEGAEQPAATTEEVEAEPVVEEEPDNTLTLEQYQKQVAAKREGSLFQTVAADNSALLKQLGGAKVLQKKADDEFAFLLTNKTQKTTTTKTEDSKAIDASLLAFKVASPAEARPERTERSDRPANKGPRAPRTDRPAKTEEGAPKKAGRGGKATGGARGGKPANKTARPAGPKVNLSEVDFPSL